MNPAKWPQILCSHCRTYYRARSVTLTACGLGLWCTGTYKCLASGYYGDWILIKLWILQNEPIRPQISCSHYRSTGREVRVICLYVHGVTLNRIMFILILKIYVTLEGDAFGKFTEKICQKFSFYGILMSQWAAHPCLECAKNSQLYLIWHKHK